MSNGLLNITLLAHSFPPVLGGGETLIYLLAKNLPFLNWKVTVVTGALKEIRRPQDCSLYKRFQVVRVPLFEEFAHGEIGNKIFLEKALNIIQNSTPDIIHAFNFYPGYLGSLASYQNKVPLIFTYFNTPLYNGKRLKMFDDAAVEQSMIDHLVKGMRFSNLITLSQYFADDASRLGIPKNKIHWCYPGADPDIFYPRKNIKGTRKALKIQDCETLIILPARVVPRKKIETLIYSVNLLKDLPIKVVISGGGYVQPGYESYHQKVVALISLLGLKNKIIMPTKKYILTDLGLLYAAADIGVMTSEVEGLGLGAIELMQSGVPVIAANTDGLKEVVCHEKNGLLFDRGNYRQLAKHIKFLIDNPDIKTKLGKGSLETTSTKFSLSNFVRMHDIIYKGAVGNHKRVIYEKVGKNTI